MSYVTCLPCTRAQADHARDLDDPFPGHDDVTLVAAGDDKGWELRLYTEACPEQAMLESLAALGDGGPPTVTKLADDDWVTLSQAGLEPVNIGRFEVHTGEHRPAAIPGRFALRIDAGLAFGTAHHPTTAGCLAALQDPRLKTSRLLDLGTGTGLLAFAAMRLHRRALATASDIDPTSVKVAAANAKGNRVRLGAGAGALRLVAAPGLAHRVLAGRAPYDLVVANILAGPLVALAPGLARAVAPGGTLILAGLLRGQARRVLNAYTSRGLRPMFPTRGGIPQRSPAEWPVLVLENPRRRPVRRGVRETAGRRPTASAW